MNVRKIDNNFAVTGQITPEQVKAVSEAGYKSIVCARPDNEEFGQPSFDEVARAAELEGIQIVHIPVSGGLGEGQIIRFHDAWEQMPKPMLGYCRSGARAGSLHATLGR
ncbi:sulfur transferase domain-containing protein [uncultured Devosia sp.]|uniref:beta-lactamase hydrolase domain-containing protein n=1 Tax=uncultured Devosia sp. TaxID=211434 RepID=UPI0026060984|nr:sulfur transferase domain-containing protein [uncultured Devosia sp.]